MFHSRTVIRIGLLVAAGAIAACGRDASTAPPIPHDAVPARIIKSITDTLRGTVGTSVGELTVFVENAEGQPIDTASVTFAINSRGGSLTTWRTRTSSTRTDTLGRASTTWTLDTIAGVQSVTATVATLAPAVFVAVATASNGQFLTPVAGLYQSAPAGTTAATNPSMRVTDLYGNPVPNGPVLFWTNNGGSINGGGGRVWASADTAGIVTVTWRLGPNVGPDTLIAWLNATMDFAHFIALGTTP